jgi:hypothetical protein
MGRKGEEINKRILEKRLKMRCCVEETEGVNGSRFEAASSSLTSL